MVFQLLFTSVPLAICILAIILCPFFSLVLLSAIPGPVQLPGCCALCVAAWPPCFSYPALWCGHCQLVTSKSPKRGLSLQIQLSHSQPCPTVPCHPSVGNFSSPFKEKKNSVNYFLCNEIDFITIVLVFVFEYCGVALWVTVDFALLMKVFL